MFDNVHGFLSFFATAGGYPNPNSFFRKTTAVGDPMPELPPVMIVTF